MDSSAHTHKNVCVGEDVIHVGQQGAVTPRLLHPGIVSTNGSSSSTGPARAPPRPLPPACVPRMKVSGGWALAKPPHFFKHAWFGQFSQKRDLGTKPRSSRHCNPVVNPSSDCSRTDLVPMSKER